MLTLISPAKKLAEPAKTSDLPATEIIFKKDIQLLLKLLKPMTVSDIASLMGLSEKLARLNFERFQDFNLKGTSKQPSTTALYLFQGDVYQSLDAISLTDTQVKFAHSHLCILSGLYGLIRPLDKIQPYRLEMGTKLGNNRGNTLYDFWQEIITANLDKTLATHKNKVIINLASNEYSKAVAHKSLSYPFITIHFKETKNGQLKSIGIHAKKARGAMARYIICNKIDTPEKLQSFNELSYQFQPTLSDDNNFVFAR